MADASCRGRISLESLLFNGFSADDAYSIGVFRNPLKSCPDFIIAYFKLAEFAASCFEFFNIVGCDIWVRVAFQVIPLCFPILRVCWISYADAFKLTLEF